MFCLSKRLKKNNFENLDVHLEKSTNQGIIFPKLNKTRRGCRQGDPIFPYVFLLCTEIVSVKIKNNKSIKEIEIGNVERLRS